MIGTGDRPSSFDGYSLTWDHAGRLTQKSGNGLTEDYHWSATGRLDSVTARDTTWRFTYDGFGRRIKRARDGWSAQDLWDGDNLFMSLSGSGGTLEATYSNLPGLDAPLAQTRGARPPTTPPTTSARSRACSTARASRTRTATAPGASRRWRRAR